MVMLSGIGGTLSVSWVSRDMNETSEQLQANWDANNLSSMLDGVTLLDKTIIPEDRHRCLY